MKRLNAFVCGLLICLMPVLGFGADSKITDLGELTTPAMDDVLAIVDVSGTPTTKKIQISNLVGLVYYADSTEADQGIAGSGRSVKDLVDSIGGNNATIVLGNYNAASTDYIFLTTEVIPSNITLLFQRGARFSDSGGSANVTINGGIDASIGQQIFDWTGSGNAFCDSVLIPRVYVHWWGDASLATMQAAHDAITFVYGFPIWTLLDGKDPITIGSGLVFSKTIDYDFGKHLIDYTPDTGIAIDFDHPLNIYDCQVRKVGRSWATDNVGVRIRTMKRSIAEIEAILFTTGILLETDTDGIAYDTFYLDTAHCYKGLIATKSTTAGWINGNSFYDYEGGYIFTSTYGADADGAISVTFDDSLGGNEFINNTFYSPIIEGNDGVGAKAFYWDVRGRGNAVVYSYLEGNTQHIVVSAAAHSFIYMAGHSTGPGTVVTAEGVATRILSLDPLQPYKYIFQGRHGQGLYAGQTQSFNNLLNNGSFEYWTDPSGGSPTGWSASSGFLSKETSIKKIGSNSLKIDGTATTKTSVYVIPSNWALHLAGKYATLGGWAYGANAFIGLDDGVQAADYTSIGIGGAWTYIYTTFLIDSSSTSLTAICLSSTGGISYFDGMTLSAGENVPIYTPRFMDETDFFGELNNIITLEDSATPSVGGGRLFETGGTTTITDFEDGVTGQIIEIQAKHSSTFDTTTAQDASHNLDGSSADITFDTGDIIVWRCENGTTWNLVSNLDASVDNN